MSCREGECDLVVLVHEFLAKYLDREERISSTLIATGVHIPVLPEIYEPVWECSPLPCP